MHRPQPHSFTGRHIKEVHDGFLRKPLVSIAMINDFLVLRYQNPCVWCTIRRILDDGRFIAGIVEEVQFIAALGHVHHILAVQGIVRHHAIDGFLYSQAMLIIRPTCSGVNARKRPPGRGRVARGLMRCPDALLQRNFDDRL